MVSNTLCHILGTWNVYSRGPTTWVLMTSRFDIDITIARHIPTSFDIVPTRCRHNPTRHEVNQCKCIYLTSLLNDWPGSIWSNFFFSFIPKQALPLHSSISTKDNSRKEIPLTFFYAQLTDNFVFDQIFWSNFIKSNFVLIKLSHNYRIITSPLFPIMHRVKGTVDRSGRVVNRDSLKILLSDKKELPVEM